MKKIGQIWYPDQDLVTQRMVEKAKREAVVGFQLDHLAAALKYVTNWTVAVDGGANIGYWSNELCKHFNKVYSFELDPTTYECLERNVNAENTTLHNVGLSDTFTTVGIADGKSRRSGGRHISGKGGNSTITIDSLELPELGFLKLDVEGHEARALFGAKETILKYKPTILIEHKPHLSKRYGGENDAVDFLTSLGANVLDKVGKNNIDWVFGW
jgi:FkbM family methyltransferase